MLIVTSDTLAEKSSEAIPRFVDPDAIEEFAKP